MGPGGVLTFLNRYGHELAAAPPLPSPKSSARACGRSSRILTGTGERMDLDLCVEATINAESKRRDDLVRDGPV